MNPIESFFRNVKVKLSKTAARNKDNTMADLNREALRIMQSTDDLMLKRMIRNEVRKFVYDEYQEPAPARQRAVEEIEEDIVEFQTTSKGKISLPRDKLKSMLGDLTF